jgi:hypothetical protein
MCGNCDQHEHVVQPLMGSLKVQFHVGVGLNVAVLVCRQIVERRTDIVLKALDRRAYAGEARGVAVAEYGGLRRKVRRRETGCKCPGYRRETMFHQVSPLDTRKECGRDAVPNRRSHTRRHAEVLVDADS